MNGAIDIVEVIREFVSDLDLSGKVLSTSDDGTNTTLVLENSYHLREEMPITIDNVEHLVISSIAKDNTVVVGGVIANAECYKVPNPFFFHGSNYIVNYEFDNLPDESKLPMFYMENLIREDWGSQNAPYIKPDFRFVVADWANFQDWQADDFVNKRLVGLRKLAWAIRQKAFDYYKFGTIDGVIVEQFLKFGVYKQDSGVVDSLFNHTLSAVGMRLTIPINNCNC